MSFFDCTKIPYEEKKKLVLQEIQNMVDSGKLSQLAILDLIEISMLNFKNASEVF